MNDMITEIKIALDYIRRAKKIFDRQGLDSGQFHGAEGEALAYYIIRVILKDKEYRPAPPREANIDGIGNRGRYSIKYWSPINYLDHKLGSNKCAMNDDLDFDRLLIVTPSSIYEIPRDKITPPRKETELTLQDMKAEGFLSYTRHGKGKFAIKDSFINIQILEDNYKVCENNFDFTI